MDLTSWKGQQKFPPTLLANLRLAVQSWAYFQRNAGSDARRLSEEVQHVLHGASTALDLALQMQLVE